MSMANLEEIENDVHDLQRRVAFLDGWRAGEAERYGRLEGDLRQLTDRVEHMDHRLSGRMDVLDQRLSQRIEHNGKRIDRLFWLMLATLTAITANLVVTLNI